eukprot:jgi/Orpsp1_1/1182320/evm.model.c7180000080817.1
MYRCLYLILLYFFIIYKKVYAKEFYIKNNDSDFYNLQSIIQNNQDNDDLILYFVDSYYDMTSTPYTIDIVMSSNISIIGNKNGTVFDYNNDKKGRFVIKYNSKGITFKIENIIFENFNPNGINQTEIILITSSSDDFFFILNNCTFKNNQHSLFRSTVTCNIDSTTEPKIIFNNCNFYNNDKGIAKLIHSYNYIRSAANKCSGLEING